MVIRSVIIAVVVAMIFSGVAETSVAQPAGQPAVRPIGPLSPLTDLAVRRIMLGDKVAAAKFGTGQPIDDPVREQQVLDTVAARSAAMGLPPAVSVRFFQAQIEANKIVQRGLVRYWRQHPAERPVTRPDLATEVRPQLDRITGEILRQLRATIKIRRPDALCGIWRLEAELSAYRINHLDKLHRNAVAVSLRPICET